ncbi:bzip transcription factor [Fusarium sporotrichioides]|uniref:Bzip transcription factor n=1 Tax=Fusarium sporotrichioides TaxID=5514 RepID=A0A395SL11_FUSSP|nr:bzip transcription factor [Fusarium sporotrichioides]
MASGQGPGPGQEPDTPGTVHSPAGQGLGPGPDDDAMSLKRDADMVNPSSPATNDESAKRRKKSGPGSRGVANLTPEQLAKKRANDREAQRAIRERTKNQIDTLERRIQELTNQQPYQELQSVLRAKEAVEQENADIKRRLAGIVAMLQPIIGQSAIEQAYVSPAQTYAPPVQHTATLSIHNSHHNNAHAASTPGSAASPPSHEPPSQAHWHLLQQQQQQQQHSHHPSPHTSAGGTANAETQAASQLTQQRRSLQHGLDMGPERLGLEFLLEPSQRVNRIQNGVNGAQDTPQFHHVPMKHDWTGVNQERALHSRSASWGSQGKPGHPSQEQQHQCQHQAQPQQSLSAAHTPESSHSPGYSPALSTAGRSIPPRSDPNTVGSAAPIKNCPPTCPLDSLLLDFLSERRQRAADGLPTQDVVGPRYPSVSSLLNPANSAYSHPLSKVFTDILATFPDISTLPERVAVLYMMFLVMRWQIEPTQENYDRLPEWMVPLPCQTTISHSAWLDHIPFPKMRERLILDHNPSLYPFDNFFVPFTTTLSLSWPYEETDTLLQDPESDELMINPVFERHLRNLDNWKLGDAFAKAFPSLVGTFNLKESTSPRPSTSDSR